MSEREAVEKTREELSQRMRARVAEEKAGEFFLFTLVDCSRLHSGSEYEVEAIIGERSEDGSLARGERGRMGNRRQQAPAQTPDP